MTWVIEFDNKAKKELAALSEGAARRITAFLHERVLDGPRSVGESLKGSRLGSLWKYRVGDNRIIASIEDSALRILVVRVGNRKNVYQG